MTKLPPPVDAASPHSPGTPSSAPHPGPAGATGAAPSRGSSGRNASLVGAGILLSRVTGLVREVVLRAMFGTTPVADAYSAALQLPKVLQNLLGEGSLSASFVPVYSEVLGRGDHEEAARLRSAVFGLLATVVTALVVVVVIAARPLSQLVLLGFGDGAKLDLTVRLTRMMAVGIGFIVLGAWCLGVLNAHRRFFLSYVAPVVWNLAIIVSLLVASIGDRLDEDVAWWGAIGVAVGGLLQFVIQVPSVLRAAGELRPSLDISENVRTVVRRFVPAVAGRGVVTLSTWIDLALASFLASGAITALASAQTLYLLPISVFAMGVAAADLPELAREQGALDVARQRIAAGTERIVFFLLFSAVAFIAAGRLVVGALFQWVSFDRDDTITVWLVLVAYAVGLVPAGLSRLLQNASYAAGDVRGPARIAAFRAATSIVLGLLLMFSFDRIGVDGGQIVDGGDLPAFSPVDEGLRNSTDVNRLGAVGLAVAGMLAAWVEYGLLRRRLEPAYGQLRVSDALIPLLPAALLAGSVGGICAIVLDGLPRIVACVLALAISGGLYVLCAAGRRSPTGRQLLGLVRARLAG